MNKFMKTLLFVLQAGGGLVGAVVLFQFILSHKMDPINLVICIVFLGLFLLGILAGILIIKNHKLGIFLSLIYQGLQIIYISCTVVSYFLFSGFRILLQVGAERIGVLFNLGSRFEFYLFPAKAWSFGINILAFALFIYLLKVRKKLITNQST